jgi:hypothetical protein
MRLSRYAALAGLAVVAAGMTPATAATKKTIVKNYTFTDATPDPTIDGVSQVPNGPTGSCSKGLLPKEKAITFKAPAAGSLEAGISGYTGDWAIEIQDSHGQVLSSGDGGTPLTLESTATKVKKPGTFLILPCNISGTFSAKLRVSFKYK